MKKSYYLLVRQNRKGNHFEEYSGIAGELIMTYETPQYSDDQWNTSELIANSDELIRRAHITIGEKDLSQLLKRLEVLDAKTEISEVPFETKRIISPLEEQDHPKENIRTQKDELFYY